MKTNPGRFFEDYRVGETIRHAVPRTLSGGEKALYHALYPARHALHSSEDFAARCGLNGPFDDLITFHTVFVSGSSEAEEVAIPLLEQLADVGKDRAGHLAERGREPWLRGRPLAEAGPSG